MLVASPSQAPSSFVLEASPAPWLFVTVEDVPRILPPSQTYELVPQYLLQAEPGYYGAEVKTLVAHHPVHQGGLSGSTAAVTLVSSVGSTSFDELAYEKGGQLWLIVAGCSATCRQQLDNDRPDRERRPSRHGSVTRLSTMAPLEGERSRSNISLVALATLWFVVACAAQLAARGPDPRWR